MRHRSPWSRGLLVATLLYLIASANTGAALASRRDRGYVTNEVIARLHPASNVRLFALSNGLDARPEAMEQLGDQPIYRLKIADGTPPPRKASQLEQDVRVQYAEPNYEGQLPEARLRSTWVVGGDTHEYVAQWASAKMHLDQAHAITRGAGITIALLDTGVDSSHPALAGHMTAGYDFVGLDDDPSEEGAYGADLAYGHGTHVAGLLALAAPDARIMPLRTLGPDGIGTIWAQVEAIRFAALHGADVINLSYSFSQPSKLMNDVIARVTCAGSDLADCRSTQRPGAVVVAAAGNSGARSREYPAADTLPGVLGVGASTQTDILASFSTYGPWVQVAAPGDHILSTIPGGGYATWSGTSMATPLTAGTIALLRAMAPSLRPSEAVTFLKATAAKIPGDVRRRVDAAATINLAMGVTTTSAR